jgi:hypothetical protein
MRRDASGNAIAATMVPAVPGRIWCRFGGALVRLAEICRLLCVDVMPASCTLASASGTLAVPTTRAARPALALLGLLLLLLGVFLLDLCPHRQLDGNVCNPGASQMR